MKNMKLLRAAFMVILAMGICLPKTVQSIERLGLIGQSWSFPMFLDPTRSFKGVTNHLDMSYFLHENWSAFLSIDTQVNGPKIFMLELGPDFYPTQDMLLAPFISPRLLYTMFPNGDAGWYISTGFEVHLGTSSQIENARFRISTGMGQIFASPSELTFIELVRIGLIWCF